MHPSYFLIFQKYKKQFILMFCLVIGAILRLGQINIRPFWLDESGSGSLINYSFTELLQLIINTGGNILYIYILKIWSLFLGNSEVALRSLSLIASLISILLIYRLAATWFNDRVGYWAAFLLSINYFSIFYAVQARPYSLVILLSILSYYYFSLSLENEKKLHKSLYFLFTLSGLYIHPWFSLLLLSQIAYLIISKKLSRLNLLIIQILLTSLFLPWALILFKYAAAGISTFIDPISFSAFWKTFKYFFAPIAWFYISISLLILVTYFVRIRETDTKIYLNFKKVIFNKINKNHLLVVVYLIIPLFLAFFISLWRPFYLPGRYDAIVLSAAIIIISSVWVKAKKWMTILIIIFLLINAFLVLNNDKKVNNAFKNNDREAAKILAEKIRPGDIVLYTDLSRPNFDYYLPRFNKNYHDIEQQSFPEAMNKKRIYKNFEDINNSPKLLTQEAENLIDSYKKRLDSHSLWLILNINNQAGMLLYQSILKNYEISEIINLTEKSNPMHYHLIIKFQQKTK